MLKEREFYCVKLRKVVTCKTEDICVKVFKNKRSGNTPALRAICPKTGIQLTKFIKRDSADKMIEKYGKCK